LMILCTSSYTLYTYTTLFRSYPAKKMDQPRVRLQDRLVGCRSVGLETAWIKCGLQSHRQKHARRLDRIGARYSSRNDRSHALRLDRKSTRLNSSHGSISYAVF